MKKLTKTLTVLLLSLVWLAGSSDQAAAKTDAPPIRIINVVYDDSGSMILSNEGKCDTWCQAKYSMEVFAAMLGDNDTMNVYVMSDFEKTKDAAPQLIMRGAEGAGNNVKKVHNMLTKAANCTPFYAVEKAREDLAAASADEKWLVVLTDGAFNEPSTTSGDIEAYFSGKEQDIKVMFFGMGAKAAIINPDEDNNVFFERAERNEDILSKITGICNRIFNSNKLDVDISTGKFEFDVPMGELVVFAQGEGVKIKDVTGPDGRSVEGGSKAVDVRYSERASNNDDTVKEYQNPMIATNLVGTLITYKGLYDAGTYHVDAENAKTIEVYYKPSVDIMAFLIDDEGNEIGSNETVEPGEYTLNFNFVKPGTAEKIEESKLLGEINYSAHMQGIGADPDRLYMSGDRVTLSEGEYTIDAYAELPAFYTEVFTQLNLSVFWNRQLGVTAEGDNPVYYITKNTREKIDGFTNAEEPTVIRLNLDGVEMSKEEWDQIETPVVEQIDRKDFRVEFTAVKSDTIGEINIYPSLKSNKTDVLGEYHDIDVKVSFSVSKNGEAWNGEIEQTIPIVDNRPWYWKHLDKVWKLGVLAAILLFLAGYLPIFKKYLPKKLKNQPLIECKPSKPGQKKYQGKGSYVKNRLSTIIPYKAETGTIRFIPKGVSGPPVLQVKAVESGRRMEVTNTKAYASAKNLTFNGETADKNKNKNVSLTASGQVVYKTTDTTYSCTLNQ